MRPLIAVLLCCQMAVSSQARGEQTFPYRTRVAAEEAYVRSGPGQDYYATAKLKRGQEVEVYRHDPGGWCAIRPVVGSFAWVPGRYLKPTDDNLAVVAEDNVSARVGSHFSDIRDVVQVRLRKGEVVELLSAAPHGTAGGEGGWVRITPPSGEFRWVSSKYLDADYPRDGVQTAPSARDNYPRPYFDETDDSSRGSSAPLIPAAALAREGPESGDAREEPLRLKSAQPRPLSPQDFEAELERIDLELSLMVIEEPAVWSFDQLRAQTNALLDQGQTAVDRGRARLLANKIARFDDIKQRHEAVSALRRQADHSSRLLAGLRPKDGDGARGAAKFDVDGRFDGVGQLTQVVSPKPGAPRYALTDQSGEVRCYVTPAPGVSLYGYLGRQVGVTGTRGYMPEQRTSHIMARHVTPLESPALR